MVNAVQLIGDETVVVSAPRVSPVVDPQVRQKGLVHHLSDGLIASAKPPS
jgi:hypothetical protein